MRYKTTILLLTLLLIATTAEALTGDPIKDGKRITACILKLVNDTAPYMTLLMLIIGGITYLASEEDTQQRLVGKNFMMIGVVGLILVTGLVAVAAMDPFNITLGTCTPMGTLTPEPITDHSRLEDPPPGTVITGSP
ncbi:MAG: hypothetical protein V1744_05590 [Candidatus Altiarchaeota archaeon]